jgi:hypothetical protein
LNVSFVFTDLWSENTITVLDTITKLGNGASLQSLLYQGMRKPFMVSDGLHQAQDILQIQYFSALVFVRVQ